MTLFAMKMLTAVFKNSVFCIFRPADVYKKKLIFEKNDNKFNIKANCDDFDKGV